MKCTLLVLSLGGLLGACGSPPSTEATSTIAPRSTAAAPATDQIERARVTTSPLVRTISVATGMLPATPADDRAMDAAIDRKLGDHHRYREVIDALQKAVANDDAAGVATLVRYPLKLRIGDRQVIVKTPQQFVARYPQLMTPDIRKAIVATSYRAVFVNYQGVMLGHGQAWIKGACKDYKCTDVDVKVVTLQHAPE